LLSITRRVYPAPAVVPGGASAPHYGSPGLLPEASLSVKSARVCAGFVTKS
jgi:hypothetical protein